MRTLRDIAEHAAVAGARLVAERAGAVGQVRHKSSVVDLVSETDVAAGVAVVSEIVRRDTDARFVVEEPEVYDDLGITPAAPTDERVWIIDPLDGTTSFLHGYPCYSVSVALVEAGTPVVGAIANAFTGEIFSAAAAQGATLDGQPLRVSGAASIPEALLVTGFPYDRTHTLDRQLAIFTRILRDVQGIRRDGSAALDLTHVASGRADGFWELSLQPWDTAAGVLLVREAGGVVTDTQGGPWRPTRDFDIVAANPRLHERLIEFIGEIDAEHLAEHPQARRGA